MMKLMKVRLVCSLEYEGAIGRVSEWKLIDEENEQVIEGSNELLQAQRFPMSEAVDELEESLLGIGMRREEAVLANVELGHGPATQAARTRQELLPVVQHKVLGPHVLKLFAEPVMHGLLGRGVEQVADTCLEKSNV